MYAIQIKGLLFIKEQEHVEVDIELEHNDIIEYSANYDIR